MMPCSSIWSRTTRRRSFAAFGFVTGSKRRRVARDAGEERRLGQRQPLAGFWK